MQRLVLAVALVASLCACTVRGGAAFEAEQPLFGEASDFVISYDKPDLPADSPVQIFTSQTPFNKTALQAKNVVFQPCAVLAAHVHPRGTEFGYAVSGSFEYGIAQENGTTVVVQTKQGQGIVLPQGSVHYVRNTACQVSDLLVYFDDPNPGSNFVGSALSSLPSGYLKSASTCGTQFKSVGVAFKAAQCSCGGS